MHIQFYYSLFFILQLNQIENESCAIESTVFSFNYFFADLRNVNPGLSYLFRKIDDVYAWVYHEV